MKRFALIDERLVEDSRLLRRTLGTPMLKRAEPVVDKGQMFGSVLRDSEGQWRMWYTAFYTREPATDLVGYVTPELLAYSKDGLHWEHPSIDLVEETGSNDRNIVIGPLHKDRNGRYLTGYGGVEGFCVIDQQTHPHPQARGRFTAMYSSYPLDSIGGIMLAHSDDGIRWEAYPENAVFPGNQDTQNILLYDERLKKYVCFHRPMIYCGQSIHANRKMARCESDDLIHWSPGRVVLDTDERDAAAWDFYEEPGNGHRARVRQFQGLSPWIANGTYLGLAWFYDARAGTFVLELVHSADGIDWKREALREPFIAENRPAGFVGKLPLPNANGPVAVGDEEYFYVSNTPYGHHEGALAGLGKGTRAERQKFLETTSIYALAVKRDRWISYDAGEREGELLTRPIDWNGGALDLNLHVEAGGEVRLGIEDEWGRPLKDWHLDEIAPIQGPLDSVDYRVTFGPGPKNIVKLPTAGPVRFRFHLRRAQLFGWGLG